MSWLVVCGVARDRCCLQWENTSRIAPSSGSSSRAVSHAPHGIGLAEPNQWSSNCCRPFGIAPDWAADLRLTGCVIRPSDCDHRSNVGPPVLQHAGERIKGKMAKLG